MVDEKLWNLIELLAAKTQSGDINWEKTATETTFQAVFSKYLLMITINGDSGSEDISLTILDEDGRIVEQVMDTQFRDRPRQAYKVMFDLYQAARRKAVGADHVIDELLKELSASESGGRFPSIAPPSM